MPNNIRELRKKHGLTLEKLAEVAGFTHATWSRLEKDQAELREQHFKALEKVGWTREEIAPDAPVPLSRDERELLRIFANLDDLIRDSLLTLARQLSSR